MANSGYTEGEREGLPKKCIFTLYVDWGGGGVVGERVLSVLRGVERGALFNARVSRC